MKRGSIPRLFGTDGIRSRVGTFPLDNSSLQKLGSILGELWSGSKVLIGRDTRISGREIKELLAAGLSDQTVPQSCGVIPTPGFSYILDHSDFDYGIMITASHNPYFDNGIKIFRGNGEKISGEEEQEIEKKFFYSGQTESKMTPGKQDTTAKISSGNFKNIYREFLLNNARELQNTDLKCVIDCANGATFEIGPEVFQELGFFTRIMNDSPDGKNINEKSGSTHSEYLREAVLSEDADFGVAFDGDGDRVIFVDGNGFLLDGDYILLNISDYFLDREETFNKVVVGTVMSNMGVENAFTRRGIRFLRAPVGDKFVYEKMKSTGSILGGEQSGHIILRNLQKTGDGILTALVFLKSLQALGLKSTEVAQKIKRFPQTTRTIKIREKRNLEQWDELNSLIKDFEEKYGNQSRILIRYSGTESKIRIMMESESEDVIKNNINKFESLIQSSIGE
jgi:phosphoglucosamine mutase